MNKGEYLTYASSASSASIGAYAGNTDGYTNYSNIASTNTIYSPSQITLGTNWSDISWDANCISLNSESTFQKFISYLREDELIDMLELILSKDPDNSDIKCFLREIILSKHMSEDFIIRYIEFINLEDLYKMHGSDIKSNEYAQIALLIEGQK